MYPYSKWGFRTSPFETTPLPPTDYGERLLVGRQQELEIIEGYIQSPPKAVTIEGPNGIGKTSVVNVASYRLQRGYEAETVRGLFVPCVSPFQLTPNQSIDEFVDNVFRQVAQTLLTYAKSFDGRIWNPKAISIGKWLNSPFLVSAQAGAFGFSLGGQTTPNTSEGFHRSGLRKFVRDWLASLFDQPGSGGIVCIIDNLELLQTTRGAKEQLEQLRDELIQLKGLRWVLCGSSGITLGMASSSRMQGYLFKPVTLGNVPDASAPEIYRIRVGAAENDQTIFMPLSEANFIFLYDVYQGNLRHTLSAADDYCQWINQVRINQDTLAGDTFDVWFSSQAKDVYDAAIRQLSPTPLQVFAKAIELGGNFSPSDFSRFGFNSSQALRSHIRDLEQAELLQSAREENDERRKSIQLTSNGWLFAFYHTIVLKKATLQIDRAQQ